MTMSPPLVIAFIAVAGFLCQWLAWRIKLPSILFLLLVGIVAGPVFGVVQPDLLLGDLLFPVVSLSVAIILFEGSLTLEYEEIRGQSTVVRRLVTLGVLITWLLTAVLCRYLLDFDWKMSLLFGSLVVVTGPTVIVPMLRTIRPNARISNVLRWEGITIDPIGALLAVVVFEYIITTGQGAAFGHSIALFFKVIVVGTLLGLGVGWMLGIMIRRRWLPELLHNYATIALVLGVFTVSNALAHESGLLAVTVMGICMANMKVHIEDILSFKESLSMLLISFLFILLAARIDLGALFALGIPAVILFLAMQFIVRPIAVAASALGSDLTWREQAMIAWIGPRGIVAAAVSGLFALKLEQLGYDEAANVVALTFVVIIGTVALQSATAGVIAKLLGVVEPAPRGALIIGANKIAREIGLVLQKNDFPVVLADANFDNVSEARMAGLPTFYGNPISEHADRKLELIGIGRLLGLSARREDNVLASMRFRPEFGRDNIFALKTRSEAEANSEKSGISHTLKGAFIGRSELTFSEFSQWMREGGKLKTTTLTEEYNWKSYLEANAGKRSVPLFAIDQKRYLHVFTPDQEPELAVEPKTGWSIISLVQEELQKEPGENPDPKPLADDESTSKTKDTSQ